MKEMKIGMILSEENREDELELQEFFTFLETERLCPEFHFTLVSSDSFFDRAKREELCSCSYLYYRRSNGDDEIISDAKVFAEKFSRVSGMIPQEYAHTDAIKWDLLMEIARAEESGNALCLEKGEAKLKGRFILKLESVPIYGNNRERNQIWAEYTKLKNSIQRLEEDWAKNREELVSKTNDLNKRSKELDQMDQAIYRSCQLVWERRKRGTTEDPRLLHAEICVIEGNIEEANEYLNDSSWFEEVNSSIKTAQDAKKQMRSYVAGQRLLISNLQAAIPEKDQNEKDQKNKRQDAIKEKYHHIVQLAEEWQVEMDLLYDYAWFLFDTSNYEEGIPLTKRLIHFLELWPDRFTVYLSEVLCLQGAFYEKIQDFDSSEKALNEAQNLVCQKEKPSLREQKKLIEVFIRLVTVYWKKHLFNEEATWLEKVEKAILDLEKHPNYDGHCDEYLGTYYQHQASLYRRKNEFSKSQHFYEKCINIREALREKDFYRYAFDLSTTYNNYALLCKDINQYPKAEELYRKAIEIRQELEKERFDVDEASTAVVEGNYATLLHKERLDSKAEQYFQEAMSSKRKYCETLPEIWLSRLAYTCIDYGNFLAVRGREEEAQALFEDAIFIRKKLMDSDTKEANPGATFRWASAYGNYGYLLCRSKRWEKALNTLKKAIQTHEELIKAGYPISKSYLCTNIIYANVRDHFDERAEACEILQKCISEFEEISSMDELTAVFYTAPIALARKTLAHLLAKEENHLLDAEQNCAKAMEAQRRLAAEVPQVYELELGLTYREMSQILEKKEETAQAQEYRCMAEKILAQYPELPEDYISDLTVR